MRPFLFLVGCAYVGSGLAGKRMVEWLRHWHCRLFSPWSCTRVTVEWDGLLLRAERRIRIIIKSTSAVEPSPSPQPVAIHFRFSDLLMAGY